MQNDMHELMDAENRIYPQPSQEAIAVTLGEKLFEFSTFGHWVNKAQGKFASAGVTSVDVLAIDAKGRVCQKGLEFMRAQDDGSFPVRVYRLLC